MPHAAPVKGKGQVKAKRVIKPQVIYLIKLEKEGTLVCPGMTAEQARLMFPRLSRAARLHSQSPLKLIQPVYGSDWLNGIVHSGVGFFNTNFLVTLVMDHQISIFHFSSCT